MARHILKNENQLLLTILHKLNELKEWDNLLRHYLDLEVAQHCQVTKFEKNCLFVIVTNGSWATRLRFQIPELLKKLKTHAGLENLNGIICKTRPLHHPKSYKSKTRTPIARLSEQTAQVILTMASTVNDLKIRQILERIASYKSHDEISG